jgi:hypothetical protein
MGIQFSTISYAALEACSRLSNHIRYGALYTLSLSETAYSSLRAIFEAAKPVAASLAITMGRWIADSMGYICDVYAPWQTLADRLRYLASKTLLKVAIKPQMNSETLRDTFDALDIRPLRPIKGHTHGVCAADRGTASQLCVVFSENVGMKPYFVQMSASDQRKGFDGSRSFYWSKDLNVQPAPYDPGDDSVLIGIDVDEYIDMPEFLGRQHQPVLLYTFQPTACAYTGEYSFCFQKDDSVTYSVSGGGKYVSHVWNYGVDSCVARSAFMGIPTNVTMYHINRRTTSHHHDLILLAPTARWRGLWAIVANYFVSGPGVERLRPVAEDGFVRMNVQTRRGLNISTGRVGSFLEATVQAQADAEISECVKSSRVGIARGMIASIVKDKRAAAMLYSYHIGNNIKPAPYVFPIDEYVRTFHMCLSDYNPDDPPCVKPFMRGFWHGAFAPAKGLANEKASIVGRIEKVRTKELRLTGFVDKCMREYVSFVCGEEGRHSLAPCHIEEVYERQSRPTQFRILETAAMTEDPHDKIGHFVKAEVYNAPKDPRCISIIDGKRKMDYSQFTYPLADYIKRSQPWYAFGKVPSDIAIRVCEVLAGAETATNSDFSRFDGRVSNLCRLLEKRLLIALFDDCYRDQVIQLHASQFGIVGYGRFGTKFELGYARASGSPETAIFNSVINSFVAFLAYRRSINPYTGNFYSPAEAWNSLGIYGGDDGLSANMQEKPYKKAAEDMGLKLETETLPAGSFGVTFLARMYNPFVWTGQPDSCCDLPRQLSKFHVTTNLPQNVSPTQKLLEKARAFVLSDSNTPILGQFVQKVLELQAREEHPLASEEHLRGMFVWFSDHDKDVHYPNENVDQWMDTYASSFDFNRDAFEEWVSGLKTLEDCLNPPLFRDAFLDFPTVKEPTIVDNELILPVSPPPPATAGESVGDEIPLSPLPPYTDDTDTIPESDGGYVEHKAREVNKLPDLGNLRFERANNPDFDEETYNPRPPFPILPHETVSPELPSPIIWTNSAEAIEDWAKAMRERMDMDKSDKVTAEDKLNCYIDKLKDEIAKKAVKPKAKRPRKAKGRRSRKKRKADANKPAAVETSSKGSTKSRK